MIIAGGGWAGCAAAVTARNAGAKVILLEKTDLLLGLGNVGGIMRNNGRFTAAEENIAMGADELFAVTDRCSRHTGLDFPGHRHASLYDVMKVEPEVRRLLREKGVDVRLMSRAVDVVSDKEHGVLDEKSHAGRGRGDRGRCLHRYGGKHRAYGQLPYIRQRLLHVHTEVPCLRTESQHQRESRSARHHGAEERRVIRSLQRQRQAGEAVAVRRAAA
ncbi:MAG: FAD-dependent oxidoreductase [Anaerovoracaceae bacterium]